jgi:hypothetical protein
MRFQSKGIVKQLNLSGFQGRRQRPWALCLGNLLISKRLSIAGFAWKGAMVSQYGILSENFVESSKLMENKVYFMDSAGLVRFLNQHRQIK